MECCRGYCMYIVRAIDLLLRRETKTNYLKIILKKLYLNYEKLNWIALFVKIIAV